MNFKVYFYLRERESEERERERDLRLLLSFGGDIFPFQHNFQWIMCVSTFHIVVGFGSPPKQMVGIIMTHQHGPLDFDPTATIIITFSGTLLFVAVGSKSNGPCWWVMRIPTICLGGNPNPS